MEPAEREVPSAKLHEAGRKRHPFKAWLGSSKARLKAAAHGRKLAPGTLQEPTQATLDDRRYLLRLREKHGPVLTAWLDGKVTTCIFGLQLGRKFLVENEDSITAATTDFTPLFPHGVLRQMNGGTHREYRRSMIDAFKAVNLAEHQPSIVSIVDDMLDGLAELPQPVPLAQLRTSFKAALTKIMFRLVLSIDPTWPKFEAMLAAYDKYAPHGTFKTARPVHIESYGEMRTLLLDRSSELQNVMTAKSLFDYFRQAERVDDTVLGNLLQMTEAGRYDLMGLWSWLIQMLSSNQIWLEKIASEPDAGSRGDLSEMAVMEALRLEQSELLLRRALNDIVFEGYFIPRKSIIRIAIWETHKDAKNFADPFTFDPSRFLGTGNQAERYGPFGLDKHRCLGADWILRISSIFVERIAQRFDPTVMADGAPERGIFHYEPSSAFKVTLGRRVAVA